MPWSAGRRSCWPWTGWDRKIEALMSLTWPIGEMFARDIRVRFRGVQRTRFAQCEFFEF
jgi:hypothetical protein